MRGDARGAEALPGETTAEYVARQEQLKREARERMRAKFGPGGLGGMGGHGGMAGVGSNSDYDPRTGKYRSERSGIQSLRDGDLSLDNAKDAAREAASRLGKFGKAVAESDTARELTTSAKSMAASAARAAGGGDLFEPSDEWRALARQILHKNDLPAPAIGDLRKLTRMVADPRKAADVFEDVRAALKPTPRFRVLQRALLTVKHLVVHGPERCVDGAWDLRREVLALRRYDSTVAGSSLSLARTKTDEGRFVREKATELAALLNDMDKIRELRAEASRSSYKGEASGIGGGGRDAEPYRDAHASRYSDAGGRYDSERTSYDPDLSDVRFRAPAAAPEPEPEPEPEPAPVPDLLSLNLDDDAGGGDDWGASFQTAPAAASTLAPPPQDGFASFQTAPTAPAPTGQGDFAAFQNAPAAAAPPNPMMAFQGAPAAPPPTGFQQPMGFQPAPGPGAGMMGAGFQPAPGAGGFGQGFQQGAGGFQPAPGPGAGGFGQGFQGGNGFGASPQGFQPPPAGGTGFGASPGFAAAPPPPGPGFGMGQPFSMGADPFTGMNAAPSTGHAPPRGAPMPPPYSQHGPRGGAPPSQGGAPAKDAFSDLLGGELGGL